VEETWIDGVLKKSLYNDALISLGKRSMDEAVEPTLEHVIEFSSQRSLLLLQDRRIATIFDATGLLLILGEPGSGKTTTLLELAANLISRAKADAKERVPVVLNLSSWKRKQSLADWIAGELSQKYRVPIKIARSWLQNDYLVPLLDGLDEVTTTLQPDCVAAINDFIDEPEPSGLVVCCRLTEYQWLPHRLKLNGAICLEALSAEEVGQYLDSAGSKLAGLRDTVNRDSVLQELAQTPLMLSLMSLACQGADSDELAKQRGDSEERRKQIFGLYVEQMFQRRGTSSLVFPKEKIIGWLSWLGRKMREHSQSVFLVEGLQPSWLGTSRLLKNHLVSC
jgi:NACHT domain